MFASRIARRTALHISRIGAIGSELACRVPDSNASKPGTGRMRLRSIYGSAVLLAMSMQAASAQQCPPNSHPVVIAIPGNLRTAHCWCNGGYRNISGICTRTQQPAAPGAQTWSPQIWPPPSGGSMKPVR
jgi:hypothetical protein